MTKQKKEINYYGNEADYIHLKFGDVRKKYNFTSNFIEKFPSFAKEFSKYFEGDKTSQFKNPFQIVAYVYKKSLPIHFYYNFTDTPAKNEKEILDYLARENSFINELK